MEAEVKLTKLASCAGCGAKLGAGTLAQMLEGFRTHADPRLIVGYDKSDDASVYVLDENNVANPVAITVDPNSDGRTFVVTSGLNAGDRIVTEGIGTVVRAGSPVTPKAQAAGDAAPAVAE